MEYLTTRPTDVTSSIKALLLAIASCHKIRYQIPQSVSKDSQNHPSRERVAIPAVSIA
jgi:hypothetical protein